MERPVGDDDEPRDSLWEGSDGVSQEVTVQADRRSGVASLSPFEKTRKDRDGARQRDSIWKAMHGPLVPRHRDQPRATSEVAFVGLPQPDLKRQQRFIPGEDRLHGIERGKRR